MRNLCRNLGFVVDPGFIFDQIQCSGHADEVEEQADRIHRRFNGQDAVGVSGMSVNGRNARESPGEGNQGEGDHQNSSLLASQVSGLQRDGGVL